MRLITTILFFLLSLNLSATTYYVKASGGTGSGLNDANAWSFAKYKSLESTLGGHTVLFNRGDIFNGSLSPVSNVTYNSYGNGAQPIITGFVILNSWTSVGTNLWEAGVAAGSRLNMVTVGGNVIEPGRFPNTGWLTMNVPDYVLNGNGDTIKIGNPRRFFYPTSGLTGYAGGNVVIKKREWIIEKAMINSVGGDSITFEETNYPALDKWGFILTDNPATLDLQNEWYYNSSTNKIRMYSTVNPSTLNVKAATINTLVSLSNSSNVSFTTIDFEGCNEDAVFSYDGGSGNSLTNCSIRFTGNNGINTKFQTNFTVQNCQIYQTNYSGVSAIQGATQYFLGNDIHHNGMLITLCQGNNKANHGLWVNGTYNRIYNNTVSYTGYVGIDFSGSYDTVRRNYVHHALQTSADGGSIYMSDEPFAAGRLIDSNVCVFGLGPRDGTPYTGFDNAMGIYLDEATGFVTVTNNFCALNNGGGMYLHRANNLTIKYNTFYGNTHQQILAAEDGPDKEKIRNVDFSNNVMHSLSSSDYIYVFYAVGGCDSFFTRNANNIHSRPSSSSNTIREIVDFFAGGDYTYSLSTWQSSFPTFDLKSTGTPAAFATGTPSIYTTFGNRTSFALDGVFQEIKGFNYGFGSALLPPYSGIVINKQNDLPAVTPQSLTARGVFRF